MNILGIESSCDDTAAAVITDERDIKSNVVWSQLKEHLPYGGVVPEIAARAHVEVVDQVIEAALQKAELSLNEVDLIAATGGPGLIGGVMVGMMTAKSLSLVSGKALIAVNHLEGHALTARLTDDVAFPYLLLLISGGHCQWLAVEAPGKYTLLGATLDDALGEAFDKTAKMLGLGYPGGPKVEKLAHAGDAQRFSLPVPLKGKAGCDFSFSGLKTAVRETIQSVQLEQGDITEQDKADICAAFQQVVSNCIADRLKRAVALYEEKGFESGRLVVAGGVAANQLIKFRLDEAAAQYGYQVITPPLPLCTDNAAMIAWAGYERFVQGERTALDFEPVARWNLYG